MNKSDALGEAVELMERVQIPGAAQRVQGLPAPVLRRHAAADHDRDGDRAGPGGADRRRADHGAGRDGPGPDHGPARRISRTSGKMGLILITHDLGVVADVADRIAVMYAGRIVEQADDLRAVREAGPPVHQGSARVDPAARPEGPDAGRDRRPAAEPDADPAGLPVQPTLPLRPGRLPGRSAATAARGGPRPARGLPLRRAAAGRAARADPERRQVELELEYGRPPGQRSTRRRLRSRTQGASDERRGHPQGREPGQALPDQGRRASGTPSARSRRSTGCRSSSTRARRSASSASPAAASRPWAGC